MANYLILERVQISGVHKKPDSHQFKTRLFSRVNLLEEW